MENEDYPEYTLSLTIKSPDTQHTTVTITEKMWDESWVSIIRKVSQLLNSAGFFTDEELIAEVLRGDV